MEITDVRIRLIGEQEKMKAVASVTFDDEFVVHDVKIIDGATGLFVAMPSRRIAPGEYRDIAHPLDSNMRGRIQAAVLSAYEKVLAEGPAQNTSSTTEDNDIETK